MWLLLMFISMLNIKSMDKSGVSWVWKFEPIDRQVISTSKGKFIRWDITSVREYGVISYKPGYPEIPVVRKFVEVPRNGFLTAKVTYEKVGNIKLDYPLYPIQPPRPKIKGYNVKFVYNENAYQVDKWYPEKDFVVQKVGILKGHEIWMIEYYPIRYNPVKNEVKISYEVKVEITYGGDWIKTKSVYMKQEDIYTRSLMRDIVVNHEVFEKEVPPAPVHYLIIVPDEWVSYAESLAMWKIHKGYYTKIATLSQTGSTNTAIKNYIQNLYNTWGLTFVVLIGDVDKIPHWVGSGSGSPNTDLNYALLEGTDYFPDVYLGRISVSSSTELENYIEDKLLVYERDIDAWLGSAWAKKAFFIASADPSNHGVAEGTHLYCMAIVRSHGMVADSFFAYYQSGAPAAITNALNDGRSWCTYSGHGSETGWADYGDLHYNVSDIYNNLTNETKYTFVQSYACETGSYADVGECFMEAWIRAPLKGAICAMGSSVTSFWDEDDILQRRIFDEAFDTGYHWVMGMINEGKIELYNHYGNTSTVRRYFEMYNLMGEPSVFIYTQEPLTLSVNHPATIPLGNYTVTVTVNDANGPVNEALVAIVRDTIIYGTAYTDVNGVANVSVDITVPGEVNIVVTALNHKPYYGNIIVGVSGPWVSYWGSQIDDASGNNNGIINPGEHILWTVLAKNVGDSTAYGVYGKLTLISGPANVTQDSSYFGNILPEDSVWGAPPYEFDVSSSAQNGDVINLKLVFRSATGDTWVSNVSLTVKAPVLEYVSYVVNDASGNGNGLWEPGEEITLYAVIENSGDDMAYGVEGVLHTSYSLVQISDSTSFYGDIAVGDTSWGDGFVVYADPSVPTGTAVPFTLTLTTSGGQVFNINFNVRVGAGGDYLIWDPDPDHSSGPIVKDILDSLGYLGDYISDNSIPDSILEILPYYKSIWVFVGQYSNNFIIQEGSPEADSLESYVHNHNGNLYLEGGDVWYWDPAYNNGHDFGPTFGLDAVDDGSGGINSVVGYGFMSGITASYSGEQNWVDELKRISSDAEVIFVRQPSGDVSDTVGISRNYSGKSSYKTVGLSIEISGLGSYTAEAVRRIMQDFFGLYTSISEKPITFLLPAKLVLKAYPNPFNKYLKIILALPCESEVEISVFDISGKKVKSIVKGKLKAGYYAFKWNGNDYLGRKVGAGVYFVKVKAGHKKLVKKVLFMR